MNREKDLKKEKVRIEEEYKKNRTLQLKEDHTRVKEQIKLVRRDIDEINESIKEIDFENINTIDKYRDYIKSKRFSGDENSLLYL
jgi:hypothetical protein